MLRSATPERVTGIRLEINSALALVGWQSRFSGQTKRVDLVSLNFLQLTMIRRNAAAEMSDLKQACVYKDSEHATVELTSDETT